MNTITEIRGEYTVLFESREDGWESECWHKKDSGLRHRKGAPAWIMTGPNGFREEHWCNNGLLHRENGPAFIRMENGKKAEVYCLRGEAMSKEEFEELTHRLL